MAIVAYDGQPLWPVEADPARLAQLRIAGGRFGQAESLLQKRPSYLLYVALAEQGRPKEAEEVLSKVAEKDGFAKALLLRHQSSGREAMSAAETLCSTFVQHRPWTPSWLARVFESWILLAERGRQWRIHALPLPSAPYPDFGPRWFNSRSERYLVPLTS